MGDIATNATNASTTAPGAPDDSRKFTAVAAVTAASTATVFDGADYDEANPSFGIAEAAAKVIKAYDRDGNGTLNVNTNVNDEVLRHEPGWAISVRRFAIFVDNLGNNDNSITATEVEAALRVFDNDADPARLSGKERAQFLATFGEQRLETRPAPGG